MTHIKGTAWSEQEIKKAIMSVMKTMGIDYMPSAKDIVRFSDQASLVGAIDNSGGFPLWRDKLGLKAQRKNTKLIKLSEEKNEEIIKLGKQGYTRKAIAGLMGVSVSTIANRIDTINGFRNTEKEQPIYESKRMKSEHIKNKETKEALELRKIEVAELCKKVVKQKEELENYYEEQRQDEAKAIKERFSFMYK